MKLLRVGGSGAEVPGVLDASGVARSLAGVVPDITGEALTADGLRKLCALDLESLPRLAPGRYGSPLTDVGKIVCVGLNYRDPPAQPSLLEISFAVARSVLTISSCDMGTPARSM